MNPLTTFVRSLGNDGAVANAHEILEAQMREDWLVQGLSRRLERSTPSAVSASAASAGATAAA